MSYLGVPMTARGRAIGALALLSGESGRRFTEEHRDLAVEIGRRAGLALDNAILYEGQRQVAETLQEALLPLELPAVEGGALARRYVASAEPGRVGGDWYDAIPLAPGRVLLCVGDVVGRGPQAAAVMGQLRGALGIFAAEEAEPGPLLDRLAGFAAGVPDAMGTTTALCLVDLASREVRYACAGHPPPLVVPEGPGRARLVPLGGALPAPGPRVERASPARRAGADGGRHPAPLHRRAGRADRASRSTSRSSACGARPAARGAPSADALCDELLGTMAAGGSADDTALLALRLDPAIPEPLEVAVPADASELATLRRRLARWLREAGCGICRGGRRPGRQRGGGELRRARLPPARDRADPHEGARRRRLGRARDRRHRALAGLARPGRPRARAGDDAGPHGRRRRPHRRRGGTVVRMARRLGLGPRRRAPPRGRGRAREPAGGSR